MKTNSIKQSNCCGYKQKMPAFQAQLRITPEVKRILKNAIRDTYRNNSPEARMEMFPGGKLCAEKLLRAYKQAFERASAGIKGEVKLVAPKRVSPYDAIEIRYNHGKGVLTKTTSPQLLMVDIFNSRVAGEQPPNIRGRMLLGQISNMIRFNR
ncbi:MAG: hypothetical protein PHC64_01840 [Candidatus Gastranaerophilales bacterium]|nr:hypothetical protein [Candidatus Gastranaerophilales bacterium]